MVGYLTEGFEGVVREDNKGGSVEGRIPPTTAHKSGVVPFRSSTYGHGLALPSN